VSLEDVQTEPRSDTVAERVARNDATFRAANERIREFAASIDADDERLLPFLCECADLDCTTVVRLAAEEYEAVRQDPRRFVNAPEHESNALGWCRVVHEFDRYTVVEKIGEAGELAEELDPRTREGS
jgi:hypothetical protein